MPNNGVLIVGSANLDLVFHCQRFPTAGETILGERFETHPGGKGANQAVAAGRLGGRVSFCGCVGRDSNGDSLRKSLGDAGVKLDYLTTSNASPSGTACILVDAAGANEIVVAVGSNFDLKPDDVRTAIRSIQPTVVVAQLEIPMECVEAASQADFFILNPAPAQSIPESILASCDIITPNESELATLTRLDVNDSEQAEAGAKHLLDQGVKNVIVTLGANGCLWVNQAGSQHFPAYRVTAVDTTAAGDAFNGALAHFLSEGFSIQESIPKASAVAALSVTKHGAQESMPSLDDLQKFLDSYGP